MIRASLHLEYWMTDYTINCACVDHTKCKDCNNQRQQGRHGVFVASVSFYYVCNCTQYRQDCSYLFYTRTVRFPRLITKQVEKNIKFKRLSNSSLNAEKRVHDKQNVEQLHYHIHGFKAYQRYTYNDNCDFMKYLI